MPSGGVTGMEGVYSPFGEFQALLRKWINREVCAHAVVEYLHVYAVQLVNLLYGLREVEHIVQISFSLQTCS